MEASTPAAAAVAITATALAMAAIARMSFIVRLAVALLQLLLRSGREGERRERGEKGCARVPSAEK